MTLLRCLAAALLLLAAGAPPAAAQDLVIGVAAPMTGNLAQIGKQFAEGAQLAADEVNARGGIKGRKVVVRVEDDKGDPKEAATVAQKFAALPAKPPLAWPSEFVTAPLLSRHNMSLRPSPLKSLRASVFTPPCSISWTPPPAAALATSVPVTPVSVSDPPV